LLDASLNRQFARQGTPLGSRRKRGPSTKA
jgi:hypothetical protein